MREADSVCGEARAGVVWVFERTELDALLLAVQRSPVAASFFCRPNTVRALLEWVFEPGLPPPPDDSLAPPSPTAPDTKHHQEEPHQHSINQEEKNKKQEV